MPPSARRIAQAVEPASAAPAGVPVLHCPVCQAPLHFLESWDTPTSEWFVYRCTRHGRWTVGPDNRFVPEPTA